MARHGQQDGRTAGASAKDFGGVCGMYWEGSAAYEAWKGTCTTQALAGAESLCPVCACARERDVAHCGVCPEFPCALLANLSAADGPDDQRIASAAYRTAAGDERWAEWAREREIWRGVSCPLVRRSSES